MEIYQEESRRLMQEYLKDNEWYRVALYKYSMTKCGYPYLNCTRDRDDFLFSY